MITTITTFITAENAAVTPEATPPPPPPPVFYYKLATHEALKQVSL